jgi:hypothetical protein
VSPTTPTGIQARRGHQAPPAPRPRGPAASSTCSPTSSSSSATSSHPNIAEVYELGGARGGDPHRRHGVRRRQATCAPLRRACAHAWSCHLRRSTTSAYIIARSPRGPAPRTRRARRAKVKLLRIVHRDFSPSNVHPGLRRRRQAVRLRHRQGHAATRIQTQTGIIKGKVKYMSPEQAFGRKLDWRSDVFSAGSVLYELWLRRGPVHGEERDRPHLRGARRTAASRA